MNPLDDPIDPRLESRLAALSDTPPRNQQAAARGRTAFLAQAEDLKSAVSPAQKPRPKGWIIPIFKERPRMITTLTSLVVIFALVFGGAGATAYASQGSMPDEPLYAVKTLTEQIQIQLAGEPGEELALQSRFLDRRFSEMFGLVEAGKELPEPFMLQIQEQMRAMLQLAAGLEDEDLQQFLFQYQNRLQNQIQRMENLPDEDIVPLQTQQRVQIMEQLQLHNQYCADGLADPALLRLRLMQAGNGNAVPPDMEPGLGPNPDAPGAGGPVETQPMNQFGPNSDKPPAENQQGPSDNSGPNPQEGPGPEAGPGLEPGPSAGPDAGPVDNGGSGGSGGNGGGGGGGGGK